MSHLRAPQGMNFLCGMLLLVRNGNEEETFWLFDAILAKMNPLESNAAHKDSE